MASGPGFCPATRRAWRRGGRRGTRVCEQLEQSAHICTHSHTRTLAHTHTHSCTLTRAHSHSRTCTYTHLHSISHTHTYTRKLSYIHLHTHTLKLTHTLTHVHTYSPAVTHILILARSNTHTHTCTLTHTRLHSHSQLGGHSVVAAHGDKGEDARAGRCWGPARPAAGPAGRAAALLLRGPLSAQWAGWARAGRGGTLSHGQFSARAVSPGIWEAELTQLVARVYRSPPRRPAPESLPGPGDTASHASGHRSGQPVAGPTDHSEKALGHGGGCLRGHFPRRCASWTSPPRQWLSVRHERV